MEAISFVLVILAAIGLLVALDLAALRYGVDSRTSVGDDHARSTGF